MSGPTARTRVLDLIEHVSGPLSDDEHDPGPQARAAAQHPDPGGARHNLLRQEAVPMTVLAQDPSVVDEHGPVRAQIPVPAERLQRGPRGHRFHVVHLNVGTGQATPPVLLHADDAWTYRDRWSVERHPDATTLSGDREFRAQNVYAVAARTLALFEQHLGRPIPWRSGSPQLYLIPQALVEANAFYSREHNGVLFGWLPALGGRPALYTALSHDVIAHEVSHAILDGLRPRFTEPGLPDQLAFHEALADLVALLSVFTVPGVARRLLVPGNSDHILFPSDADALRMPDREERAAALLAGRAVLLMHLPLARLAEEVGGRAQRPSVGDDTSGRFPALRWSVVLEAGDRWKSDPQFAEPHRRAEVLVAAFMQTLVTMWAGRLEPLRVEDDGLDADRVAEEGVKSARHLLAMLLRGLDYLPPVDLGLADVIDAVLTADRRLAPEDEHDYRTALEHAFAGFGITSPRHPMVDADGMAAPAGDGTPDGAREEPAPAVCPPDPDADTALGLRYEHLNLVALRTSPEAVYEFIWNNAAVLQVDVRFPTRVERVLSSTRVGPDGLVVTEILADYTQRLRTAVRDLPPGIRAPDGMAPEDRVELWGGGVLVFDQFGRFRLHQRQPLLDPDRQTRRLQYLVDRGLRGQDGAWGSSDGLGEDRRLALLHPSRRAAVRTTTNVSGQYT
ncbi:hypothetical protein [Blastococcus mobilis]|uniref:Uncharacterized protein n=1 Tax=Blastococcus mobilis TaxID=1938746 RepID=A0A238UQW7_9ACTN|nr:hypothetical protein [Blastococcus mobilis]SNR24057.1 hypothetical protein SAMN06272737_101209 [Blastococcus mobilis]